MGFTVRMNPCCFPNADVFAEAHISEDLTVNQYWDVRSDVYLCFVLFLASSALKSNWIYLRCLSLSE